VSPSLNEAYYEKKQGNGCRNRCYSTEGLNTLPQVPGGGRSLYPAHQPMRSKSPEIGLASSGLKVRPDLRMTPPQGSAVFDSPPRASSRLLRQPRLGYTNWLYIPGALSDRPARANAKRRGLPTSLRRATALCGVRGSSPA
jgi:hypothetical protein